MAHRIHLWMVNWPPQYFLTDRAGWAVCLTGLGRGLGCDLELVEPRSELFVHDYMTETETAFVSAEPAGPARDLAANLIWSTKESALKVLRTGLRRDTRSVEVTLGSGLIDGWRELTVATDTERVFPGWWQRFGDFVLTDAGSPLPTPSALFKPPGWPAGPRRTPGCGSRSCNCELSTGSGSVRL